MKSNQANSNQVLDRNDFWLNVSRPSIDAIWDNSGDDIYVELLEVLITKSGETNEYLRRNN